MKIVRPADNDTATEVQTTEISYLQRLCGPYVPVTPERLDNSVQIAARL